MPTEELNNLIKMANHIADNIAIGESQAVTAPKVAAHLSSFWARPMKDKIIDYALDGGDNLNVVAKQAVLQLQEKQVS